jgi:hypothetical protein
MTSHRKQMQAVYQRRYRQRLRSAGLTCRGTPRKNLRHKSKGLTPQQRDRLYYIAKRERLYDRCLTTHRTPRKIFRLLPPVELRERHLARQRNRRQNFIAQGLTANGTPRKRGVLPPLEAEYRAFRATLNLSQAA